MLYLISGKDFKANNTRCKEIIKKYPKATRMEYNEETFSDEVCQELLSSQELFGNETLVILSGVLEKKDDVDYILKNLKDIQSSKTIFIFLEGEITKKIFNQIKKRAEDAWFSEDGINKRDVEFSIFSLTDAVGKRDKKRAWIILQRAYSHGIAPESIYGTLFWHIKTLALVQGAQERGEDLSNLNLKPFVVNKTLGFLRNYNKTDIQKMLKGLIDVYHRAHGGKEEFDIGLEKLLLKI